MVEGIIAVADFPGNPFCRVWHQLHQPARAHTRFRIRAEGAFIADDGGDERGAEVVFRRIALNQRLVGDGISAFALDDVIVAQRVLPRGFPLFGARRQVRLHQVVRRQQPQQHDAQPDNCPRQPKGQAIRVGSFRRGGFRQNGFHPMRHGGLRRKRGSAALRRLRIRRIHARIRRLRLTHGTLIRQLRIIPCLLLIPRGRGRARLHGLLHGRGWRIHPRRLRLIRLHRRGLHRMLRHRRRCLRGWGCLRLIAVTSSGTRCVFHANPPSQVRRRKAGESVRRFLQSCRLSG